ncbi:MAG: DUF2271 domain-containing protein [Pseudomonadota bacterium]
MSSWRLVVASFSLIVVTVIAFASSEAVAGQRLEVEFELPPIATVDYNKPYVAIWAERAGDAETLLLWHLKGRADDKWLPDIRRWWRKDGRYGLPVDTITGATRGPGRYRRVFDLSSEAAFTLCIEVVREDGGRTLLKQALTPGESDQEFRFPADKELGPTIIRLRES